MSIIIPILQQRVLRIKPGEAPRSLISNIGRGSCLTIPACAVWYLLVFLVMLAPRKERLGNKICCTLLEDMWGVLGKVFTLCPSLLLSLTLQSASREGRPEKHNANSMYCRWAVGCTLIYQICIASISYILMYLKICWSIKKCLENDMQTK